MSEARRCERTCFACIKGFSFFGLIPEVQIDLSLEGYIRETFLSALPFFLCYLMGRGVIVMPPLQLVDIRLLKKVVASLAGPCIIRAMKKQTHTDKLFKDSNCFDEKKGYPIVLIQWTDAFGSSGWRTHDEMVQLAKDRCLITEVGILVDQKKDNVMFCGCLQMHQEGKFDYRYANTQSVPRTWIHKMKIIGYTGQAGRW